MASYQSETLPKLKRTVAAAARAVTASEGLNKLEECVRGLERSQAFNLNFSPPVIADDDELIDFLEIRNLPSAQQETAIAAWREHCRKWSAPVDDAGDAVTLSPAEVFGAWKERFMSTSNSALRLLAARALRSFSRPISSAVCERIFCIWSTRARPIAQGWARICFAISSFWRVTGEFSRRFCRRKMPLLFTLVLTPARDSEQRTSALLSTSQSRQNLPRVAIALLLQNA